LPVSAAKPTGGANAIAAAMFAQKLVLKPDLH